MEIKAVHDYSSIVSELNDDVFRLIRRIVGDRDQALDLTQDVFVKILSGDIKIKDWSRRRAYVLKSAFNVALNFKRDRGRRTAKHELIRQQAETLDEQHQVTPELDDTCVRLTAALESLAAKQREALTLRFFGDLSIAEVALIMSVSVGAVKVHLARGLKNLHRLMREDSQKELI
ncbi:MAG: RNA polymerase sigma factor [Candidatus Zixiibacteriota bacterium]